MAFFSKNSPADTPTPGALPALTKDRVKHALEAAGWSYGVDEDGDIGGGWEYGSFFFFTNGKDEELLCVRGSWRGQLTTAEQRAEALELCNTWNATRIWPKAYVHTTPDEVIRVFTEVNVDYEHGLTDDQLSRHLLCAVETSMSFFETLNEAFPDVWEQCKPAEQ